MAEALAAAGAIVVIADIQAEFRADVAEIDELLEQMIWRVVTRYTELTGRKPTCTSPVTYAMFDGVFQQALLGFLSGAPDTLTELDGTVRHLLDLVVPG